MSNHFKSPSAQSVSLAPATMEAATQALTAKPQKLGWFKNRALKQHEDQAQLDIAKSKADAIKGESIATAAFAASLQGTAVRTGLARVYGEVIATEMSVMTETHSAIALEQKTSRFSGSIVNIQARNEHMNLVKAMLARGEISADDASALIGTALELHFETESRMDGMYQETAQTTDRVFKGGFIPVNHRINSN